MSIVNIEFTGTECACIYASVSKELGCLEEDLNNPDATTEELENIPASIETCKTILSKLSDADSTYSVRD